MVVIRTVLVLRELVGGDSNSSGVEGTVRMLGTKASCD